MRRLLGAGAAALVLCAGMAATPTAAQETAVTLRLQSQTPWVAKEHRGTLDLEVLVFNGSSGPLKDVHLDVSFGEHITTQADYEAMLSTGVSTFIAPPETKTVRFDIEEGGSPIIPMSVDMERISAIDQADSQVYPALVTLRSGATTVASLVTPVIYLVQDPQVPMLSATWVQVTAPIAFGADGRLVDSSFPAAIAEGGALRAPLDAIAATTGGRHPHGVLDLVLDPLVINQARQVQAGYLLPDGTQAPGDVQARRFLHRLTGATGHPDTVETVVPPYGDPVLPAMLESGLSGDLALQRAAGLTVAGSLDPDGTEVASSVARPNGGRLSDSALDWLANAGVSTVLADAGTVDRSPYQLQLAPSPTVPRASQTLVLPDPTTQALFDRSELFTDPERAAQIILGELAVIWKQQPVPEPPFRRGVAIAPPPTLPPAIWPPLLGRLSDAPFLTPVTATQLVEQIVPPNPNDEAGLVTQDASDFDAAYAADIDGLASSVETYASMLPADSQIPTDLRRRLFLATAPPYLIDPGAGRPWLSSVEEATQGAFGSVTPIVSESFTFTSGEGTIPIQFGDPGATPLQVTVELRSPSFTFPEGDRRGITLERPGQLVTPAFRVVAAGSGQHSIRVSVLAPNGQEITNRTITVRSTAVNRIALLVTLGAALGLVALYARRWVRRRRSTS